MLTSILLILNKKKKKDGKKPAISKDESQMAVAEASEMAPELMQEPSFAFLNNMVVPEMNEASLYAMAPEELYGMNFDGTVPCMTGLDGTGPGMIHLNGTDPNETNLGQTVPAKTSEMAADETSNNLGEGFPKIETAGLETKWTDVGEVGPDLALVNPASLRTAEEGGKDAEGTAGAAEVGDTGGPVKAEVGDTGGPMKAEVGDTGGPVKAAKGTTAKKKSGKGKKLKKKTTVDDTNNAVKGADETATERTEKGEEKTKIGNVGTKLKGAKDETTEKCEEMMKIGDADTDLKGAKDETTAERMAEKSEGKMKIGDFDTGLKGAKDSAGNEETGEIMKGTKEAAGKEEMGEDKKKKATGEV